MNPPPEWIEVRAQLRRTIRACYVLAGIQFLICIGIIIWKIFQ